jgi:hypothetical protein
MCPAARRGETAPAESVGTDSIVAVGGQKRRIEKIYARDFELVDRLRQRNKRETVSHAHGGHRRGIAGGAAGTESHDWAEWAWIAGESACQIVIFLIHATRFRPAWCLCLGSCERIEIGLARLARARLIGNLSS